MRKAGGIIAIIAGIFGMLAAITTLFLGGIGAAFSESEFADIPYIGWISLISSITIMILGAVTLSIPNKIAPILIIIVSIIGAISGNMLTIIFMLIGLISGIIAICDPSNVPQLSNETKRHSKTASSFGKKQILQVTIPLVLLISAIAIYLAEQPKFISSSDIMVKKNQPQTLDLSSYMIDQQRAFIQAVEQYRQEFNYAQNDMAAGATKYNRSEIICNILKTSEVTNWVGVIDDIGANNDGKGILSIKISEGVYVSTNNNALSDIGDNTLIEPNSNLFRNAANLSKGDVVKFSGNFHGRREGCIYEKSLSLSDSMTRPDFLLTFTNISKLTESHSSTNAGVAITADQWLMRDYNAEPDAEEYDDYSERGTIKLSNGDEIRSFNTSTYIDNKYYNHKTGEITTMPDGEIEVVTESPFLYRVSGQKSYFNEGGAFWFNTVRDADDRIVAIEASDKEYAVCLQRSNFLNKTSFTEDSLALVTSDEICVTR